MTIQKSEAIEVTTFKLQGCSIDEFITANQEIDVFLKRQIGFRSRKLFEINGLIYDLLIWDSEQNGTNAMHKLMVELSHSPVHKMINQQTVSWNITTVKHIVNSNSV